MRAERRFPERAPGFRQARGRAFAALALFALGTLIGVRLVQLQAAWSAPLALSLGGCAAALSVFVPPRRRSFALGVGLLLLGVGWSAMRLDPHRPDRLVARVGAVDPRLGSIPIEVRGVVTRSSRLIRRPPGPADPPRWPEATNEASVLVHQVLLHEHDARMDWVRTGGTLRVLIPEGVRLRGGQRVELLGRYTPPNGRRNPGDPDWALLAAQSGRVGTLVIEHDTHIRPRPPGGLGARVLSALLALRDEARQRALDALGGEEQEGAAIRSALLLGEREPGFDAIYARFQRVGVAHVLAVSGFHLSLAVSMGVLCVRCLGDYPRLEMAVVLLVLLGAVVLIPLRPPIVRASAVIAGVFLATRAGRRYDPLTVLAWVGLGLLLWRPLDATSLGWQLSMGVTGLLVALGERRRFSPFESALVPTTMMRRRTPHWARAGRWVWELVRVNTACWLLAMPALMYHSGVVGVLAPLASVALLLPVALLMAMGIGRMLVGIIAPGLTAGEAGLLDIPTRWVLGLIEWCDALPFSWVRLANVSGHWAAAATLVLGMILSGRWRRRRARWIGALIVVTAWGLTEMRGVGHNAPLRVVMLDVGDGSCVIVQSGRRALLWDCGSLDRRMGERVADALRTLGVTRLSEAIVTHDNIDHYNALPELTRWFPIERVRITARLRDHPSPSWRRVRETLERRGVRFSTIARGDRFSVGRARFACLWPEAHIAPDLHDNDTSCVLLGWVEGAARGATLLLTGDIEERAMDALRSLQAPRRPFGDACVLEMPHHGSVRRAAMAFVDWVDPAAVLQSTGPSRLDDPRFSAQRDGRLWLVTAHDGALLVEFTQQGQARARPWFAGKWSELQRAR